MFNPNNTFDVTKIWNQLGNFYSYIDNDQKTILENFWKGLLNGTEGLYYNLAQAYLSFSFDSSPGYIEISYNIVDLIYRNYASIYCNPPTNLTITSGDIQNPNLFYTYYVTGKNKGGETTPSYPVTKNGYENNILNWELSSGISSYNIYRFCYNTSDNSMRGGLIDTDIKDNTYSDYISSTYSPVTTALPSENTAASSILVPLYKNMYALSIPMLSGMYTNNILYEGVDYYIYNGKYLCFDSINSITDDKYLILNGIALNPLLTNLYLKTYIVNKNIMELLEKRLYTPHIKNYNNLSYFEQQKIWAFHLWKLVQAIVLRLMKGPTIKNMQESLSLFYNIPFSYEEGIVTNITDDIITISGENIYEYEIPNNYIKTVKVQDAVAPVQLLCSGVRIYDYINNFTLISGIAQGKMSIYSTVYFDIPDYFYDQSYYSGYIHFFEDSIVPPNLLIYPSGWNKDVITEGWS